MSVKENDGAAASEIMSNVPLEPDLRTPATAEPSSIGTVAPSEPSDGDLARAQLRQDRYLKERELQIKDREVDLKERESLYQRQQTWWARWSAPSVVAIVAGLIGYCGTLITSCQTRQLERQKQEGILILEAIKTAGSTAERERQTAANIVFLADAHLITSIQQTELDKLRAKAQGAGPSLPAAQGIEFKRSSGLTAERQAELQSALTGYQQFLARLGYDASKAKDRVVVRVGEEDPNNAYFDKESVVIGLNLASDPEYLLSEYTWYVLKQANTPAFEALWDQLSVQAQGFMRGLRLYLTCSYLNDPNVGKNYYALVGTGERDRGPLFRLDTFRAFDPRDESKLTEHLVAEIWGGALWELREKFGRDAVDRLAFAAWQQLEAGPGNWMQAATYVEKFVNARASAGVQLSAEEIRQPFLRRNLK